MDNYGTLIKSPVGDSARLAIYYREETGFYTVVERFMRSAHTATSFLSLQSALEYVEALKPLYEAWLDNEIAFYDKSTYDPDSLDAYLNRWAENMEKK